MAHRTVSKKVVMIELQRIGAELYSERQTTQEKVRMHIVKYQGKLNGFRSLIEIINWAHKIRTSK